jgi:hypothetical protein
MNNHNIASTTRAKNVVLSLVKAINEEDFKAARRHVRADLIFRERAWVPGWRRRIF